jgi:8-oxo-dGTP diphosphatase
VIGAGLMMRASRKRFFIVQRSIWVDQPLTWTVPGGSVSPGEDTTAAALREFAEEVGRRPRVTVRGRVVHGTFTTVLADGRHFTEYRPNFETSDAAWVTPDDMTGFALHPGFAAALPAILEAWSGIGPHA